MSAPCTHAQTRDLRFDFHTFGREHNLFHRHIAATFARRQTALPTERPFALTKQFSEDTAKLRQWQAFLNKNRLEASSLADTVTLLRLLLWPATQVAVARSRATATWEPAQAAWR